MIHENESAAHHQGCSTLLMNTWTTWSSTCVLWIANVQIDCWLATTHGKRDRLSYLIRCAGTRSWWLHNDSKGANETDLSFQQSANMWSSKPTQVHLRLHQRASPNISLNDPRKPPSIGFYKDYQIWTDEKYFHNQIWQWNNTVRGPIIHAWARTRAWRPRQNVNSLSHAQILV